MCPAVNRVHLDEVESAALLMLLFSAPRCRDVLKPQTLALLDRWRDETLRGLAEHIERTGRNVDERMADIVFLSYQFQVCLVSKKRKFSHKTCIIFFLESSIARSQWR